MFIDRQSPAQTFGNLLVRQTFIVMPDRALDSQRFIARGSSRPFRER